MKGSQEVRFAQTESKTKMWCKDYQRCTKHELQTFLHHPTPQPQANLRILVVSHGLHRRWQATLWFEKSSDPRPGVLSKSVKCIQTLQCPLQCPLQIYTNLYKSPNCAVLFGASSSIRSCASFVLDNGTCSLGRILRLEDATANLRCGSRM